MTNNELLLAISDMMDKKLDTRLKPIENNLQSVKNEMHQMKLYQENVIMPRLQNIEAGAPDFSLRVSAQNQAHSRLCN